MKNHTKDNYTKDNYTEQVTANKQDLINAVKALERQETYRHLQLEVCMESLKSIADKLQDMLDINPAYAARTRLLKLFMEGREWDKIITDELIEQWDAEFKNSRG